MFRGPISQLMLAITPRIFTPTAPPIRSWINTDSGLHVPRFSHPTGRQHWHLQQGTTIDLHCWCYGCGQKSCDPLDEREGYPSSSWLCSWTTQASHFLSKPSRIFVFFLHNQDADSVMICFFLVRPRADPQVYINPDRIAAQLPEYHGYIENNRACAAVMTRLEAGLLTELSLMYALQKKRSWAWNLWIRPLLGVSKVLQFAISDFVQGFPSAKLDSWGMFRVVIVNPKMITDPLLEESSSAKCV